MDTPDTTFDRDRGLLNTPPSPPMRVDRHSEAISGPAMGGSLVNLVDNTTGDARDGSPASPGRNDLGDSATDRHRLSPPCGARAAVPSHMCLGPTKDWGPTKTANYFFQDQLVDRPLV